MSLVADAGNHAALPSVRSREALEDIVLKNQESLATEHDMEANHLHFLEEEVNAGFILVDLLLAGEHRND